MWGQATQLPWGKPYLQDIKSTLMHADPGYQEARRWWEESRANDEARTRRMAGMRAEIERLNSEISNSEKKSDERADSRNESADAIRGVSRTADTDDEEPQFHLEDETATSSDGG